MSACLIARFGLPATMNEITGAKESSSYLAVFLLGSIEALLNNF